MTADEIRDALYEMAVNDLRSSSCGYVLDLDDYVCEIVAENEEKEKDGEE